MNVGIRVTPDFGDDAPQKHLSTSPVPPRKKQSQTVPQAPKKGDPDPNFFSSHAKNN